jgi:hypothetical protein
LEGLNQHLNLKHLRDSLDTKLVFACLKQFGNYRALYNTPVDCHDKPSGVPLQDMPHTEVSFTAVDI